MTDAQAELIMVMNAKARKESIEWRDRYMATEVEAAVRAANARADEREEIRTRLYALYPEGTIDHAIMRSKLSKAIDGTPLSNGVGSVNYISHNPTPIEQLEKEIDRLCSKMHPAMVLNQLEHIEYGAEAWQKTDAINDLIDAVNDLRRKVNG
jgi:hypothetical protein